MSPDAKFTLSQTFLSDGKIEIRIIPIGKDSTDVNKVNLSNEPINKEYTEWINSVINKPVPYFSLMDVSGRTITSDQLQGKITVMNFWFTTCSPCIKEMPLLNQLLDKYQRKDIQFIAPSLNDKIAVTSFLKSTPFAYQILLNAQEFVKNFGVSTFPTSLLIDRKGIVRKVFIGFSGTIDEMDTSLRELIADN